MASANLVHRNRVTNSMHRNRFGYRKVIAENYKFFLNDLQVQNIRDEYHRERLITNLTLLAYQDRASSEQIVDVIRNQFRHTCPQSRILIIYLIHSIVTSVGDKYIDLFNKHIVEMFNVTMNAANSDSYKYLFNWREKWDCIFSKENLYRIDVESQKIVSFWPILPVRSIEDMIKNGNDSLLQDVWMLKRLRDSLVVEIEYCRRPELLVELDPNEEHPQKKRKIDELILLSEQKSMPILMVPNKIEVTTHKPKVESKQMLTFSTRSELESMTPFELEETPANYQSESMPEFNFKPASKLRKPEAKYEMEEESKQIQKFKSRPEFNLNSNTEMKSKNASKKKCKSNEDHDAKQSELKPERYLGSLKMKIDLITMRIHPMYEVENEESVCKGEKNPSVKCSVDLSRIRLPTSRISVKDTKTVKQTDLSNLNDTRPAEEQLTENNNNTIHKMDVLVQKRSKEENSNKQILIDIFGDDMTDLDNESDIDSTYSDLDSD